MGNSNYKPWKDYHKKHIHPDGTTKRDMYDPKTGEFHRGKNAEIVETKNNRLAVKAEHPHLNHHMFTFIGKRK